MQVVWCNRPLNYLFTFMFSVLGNKADNYSDIGHHTKEDVCCREHDFCDKYLKPGDCERGICNKSPFTRWETFRKLRKNHGINIHPFTLIAYTQNTIRIYPYLVFLARMPYFKFFCSCSFRLHGYVFKLIT